MEHVQYAYVNQQLVPQDQAFLHVSDLAIQRGYGVFEFCKLHQQVPLFLEEYLDRFYQSAALLELVVPLEREALKVAIQTLAKRNRLEVSGMKMILTGGYSINGYAPATPNLILLQQPLTLPGEEQVKKGIRVMSHAYMRELPLAKTINYMTGIRLLKEMRKRGAEDVLYHQQGVVTELPRCNFFIVRQDNTVVTPSENILRGITRKNVLQLAARKYPVVEGAVTLEDIAQAKEAFLTSTTKRILPIVQLDDMVIGEGRPGPITLELSEDLIRLEEAQLALHKQLD